MRIKLLSLFILFVIEVFPQGSQSILPLYLGNTFEVCQKYGSNSSYGYSYYKYSITEDTIIQKRTYYKYKLYDVDPSYEDAWLRNAGDSVVYSRFQDADYPFIDLGWEVGSTYSSYFGGEIRNVQIIENNDVTYLGKKRRKITIYFYLYNGSVEESYIMGIGKIHSSFGLIIHGIGGLVDLTSYKIYNNINNYNYYDIGDTCNFTNSSFEDQASRTLNIKIKINHNKDDYDSNLYGSFFSSGAYIDSCWMEYYYEKSSSNSQIERQILSYESYAFNGQIIGDNNLLNDDYVLKYRIVAKDKAIIPNTYYYPNSGYFASKLVGIEDKEKVAYSYKLNNNYPNPFNPSTTISFEIPNDDRVTITVYDVLGNKVKTLLDEYRTKGINNVVFNADNLSSGIYFYQVKFRGKVLNGKMNLIK